jgi:hypothetical protein
LRSTTATISPSCAIPVVAGGKRSTLGARLLVGELVGVALARIDEDGEVSELGGATSRHADPGPGLAGGARRLPEDPLATALDAGEHELRAVLPRPVEHQVDRDPASLAGANRDALDDLRILGPALGAVAVDLRGPRPAVARLEHQLAVREWQPDQERQRRIRIWVGSNLEHERL